MDLSQSDSAIKILELLKTDGGWCGIQKISDQSKIPKSLAIEIIHDLVATHQLSKYTDVNTKKNWYHIENNLHLSPNLTLTQSNQNLEIEIESPCISPITPMLFQKTNYTEEIELYLNGLEQKYGQFGNRSQIIAAVNLCVEKLTTKIQRSMYIQTLILLHYLGFNSTQTLPKLSTILQDLNITTTQFLHRKSRLLEWGIISPSLKFESSLDSQITSSVIQKSLLVKIKMDKLELQKKWVHLIGEQLQLSTSEIDSAMGILPRLSKWNNRAPNLIAGIAICLVCQSQKLPHKPFKVAEIGQISQSVLYLLLKEVKESPLKFKDEKKSV